jgi:hypothetical protein
MDRKRVPIPGTIEEATEALVDLDALLRAKGWQRAAIVFAFTEAHERHDNRHTVDVSSDIYTFTGFAALGIAGLSSKNTVQHYHEAWIEGGGRKSLKPGEEAVLPSGPFPPQARNLGSRMPKDVKAFVRKAIEDGTIKAAQIVSAAVEVDDKAVYNAMLDDPEVVDQANDWMIDHGDVTPDGWDAPVDSPLERAVSLIDVQKYIDKALAVAREQAAAGPLDGAKRATLYAIADNLEGGAIEMRAIASDEAGVAIERILNEGVN